MIFLEIYIERRTYFFHCEYEYICEQNMIYRWGLVNLI